MRRIDSSLKIILSNSVAKASKASSKPTELNKNYEI